MSFVETATVVLAQGGPPPGDPGGQGEDFGKSSPVGLLLLVLFAIAVAFLVRSMSKHLKKLPTNFDEERAAAAAPAWVRAKAAAAQSESAPQEEGSSAEEDVSHVAEHVEDKDESSDDEQHQRER